MHTCVRAYLLTAWLPVVLAGVVPAGAAGDVELGRPRAGDVWLDRVRAFVPGPTAGFGAEALPDIVLGSPEGFGALEGSTDVVSLGKGGSIVVSFDDNAVLDGPGDDLVIFENAFHAGSESGPIFTEYAFVEVSRDGKAWSAFPYDGESGAGLAGQTPVLANSSNHLDPLDPGSGGDRFDIGALGLDLVRFVRLTDAADIVDDYGNHSFPGTKGGFDLDAAAAVHSVPLGRVVGVVSEGGKPVAGMRVRLRGEKDSHWRARRTRADGHFRFARVLPDGEYTVETGPAGQKREQQVYLDLEQIQVRADFELP